MEEVTKKKIIKTIIILTALIILICLSIYSTIILVTKFEGRQMCINYCGKTAIFTSYSIKDNITSYNCVKNNETMHVESEIVVQRSGSKETVYDCKKGFV
jgi:hypothetical protein